jgi:uncharacterized SAM-binding protein YcdF (DUF218 family)
VSEEKIIKENRSTNTEENLALAQKMMTKRLGQEATAIIVTSNYHVLRAVTLAREQGLNAQGIGSPTPFYYWPAGFIREYIALLFSYPKWAVIYVVAVILFQTVR